MLDVSGGPSWANISYDAPIIINATAQEFYKQPTYYALAHFRFEEMVTEESKLSPF